MSAAGRLVARALPGLAPPEPVPERAPVGTPLVEARGVAVDLGGRRVLQGADLTARAGELVALVGPNGAGKSTLLHALGGDVPVAAGDVLVVGEPLARWTPVALARRRAVLPQHVTMTFPFPVVDVVRMGRAPWAGTEAADRDDDVVDRCLERADVAHLRHRRFLSLSGGERARVALARVLAQEAQLLLLDEPTAALDLRHQELVLAAARQRVTAGDAVVVVLHDLGLAAAYADRVVLLAAGVVHAAGPPAAVLTADRLSALYDHDLEVLPHPRTGALLVLPRRDVAPTA